MPTSQERAILRRANRQPQSSVPATACPHCSREFSTDIERVTVQNTNSYRSQENISVCIDCQEEFYSSCNDCDESCHDGDIYSVDNGEDQVQVCPGCYNESYNSCNNCGDRMLAENICDGYCETCADNNGSIRLRGYRENKEKYLGTDYGAIIQSLRPFGVELEIQLSGQENAVKLSRELEKEVGITGDASIRGLGLEIVTPPASGDKAQELIERVCKEINKQKAKVDQSCGMHVHIDVNDIDKYDPIEQFRKAKKIWLTYIVFEDVIRSFLSPSRLSNVRYCASLESDYHFKEIAEAQNMEALEQIWYRVQNKKDLSHHKGQGKHGSRYRGINMHTMFSERHLEIRYHMGTTIARKVLEWANLHIRIIDIAMSQQLDVDSLKAHVALDLNQKTTALFNLIQLPASSETYFRTRQAHFASKPKPIEKRLHDAAIEVLSAEVES